MPPKSRHQDCMTTHTYHKTSSYHNVHELFFPWSPHRSPCRDKQASDLPCTLTPRLPTQASLRESAQTDEKSSQKESLSTAFPTFQAIQLHLVSTLLPHECLSAVGFLPHTLSLAYQQAEQRLIVRLPATSHKHASS